MKRLLSFILVTVLLFTPVLSAGALVSSKPTGQFSLQLPVIFHQSEARKVLKLMNEFRAGKDAWYWNKSNTQKVSPGGLEPMKYDFELEKVAMQRAAEAVVNFSHTRPNGTLCFTAYDNKNGGAENLAAGYRTANDVVTGWREDDEAYDGQGHRRNMLSSTTLYVGVACAEYNGICYWAQAFSSSASETAQTQAIDERTVVDISVSPSQVVSYDLAFSEESFAMNVGDKKDLPKTSLTLKLKESWYPVRIAVAPVWTSGDRSIVTIENNQLCAVSGGSCKLSALLHGQNIQLPVTVHAHEPEIIPPVTPTCVTDGYTAGSRCKICGAVLEEQTVIPALAHSYTVNETKAGYRKDGKVVRVCSLCGLRESTDIPAVSSIRLTGTKYIFDGKRHTPKVRILDATGKKLQRNVDYTLTYPKGRVEVGAYSITVCFIGNYAGTKTVTYKILPAAVTGLKVKPGKNSAALSWSAAPGATDYIVYYSLSKDKGYKKLGSTKKTTATMVQLDSGRTYYFRVRSITRADDKQWNGALSSPIRVVAK